MTTEITAPELPRRSDSTMRTRAVNAAAGVLLAAMEQGRQIPTSLAIALDSAGLLNSPEHAAEHERLLAERHETNEWVEDAAKALRANQARIAELEAAPTEVYRAEHPDSGITLGHYGTAAAAREHCEEMERRSWPTGTTLDFDWIEDDEDRIAELVVTAGQNEESATGYLVTALEVPSVFDPDADE